MSLVKYSLRSIALFISIIWMGFSQAQESVNTAGGDVTGSGGSVAFSIGQVDFSTYEGTTGKVSEGVQKAYDVFTVGVKETRLDITLDVFPNPTSDRIILAVSKFKNENLSYQLYNMQGKLILKNAINQKRTQIEMKHLAAANYIVHIVKPNNQKIQSFKILKIK